jgi:asparagine synthase (glutamine-hydrolysing)
MERGRCSVAYNGEIYNYVEIREELIRMGYTFATSSDTEVILVAYEAWGESCVERFMGMWAFALWDGHKQKLFCSRDRFGIKPFYYIWRDGRFYFASEVKALRRSPVFSGTLNTAQVGRFLQLGWVTYAGETFFEGLEQLPAAHNLSLSAGELRLQRYWDLANAPKVALSFEEAREAFRRYFYDSIRLHMRSDVEVGACLSGGIDSSAVVSVVGDTFPGLAFNTFTIYYTSRRGMDERPFAESVLQKYPNLHPHFYEPGDQALLDAFDHFVWVQDFPIAGSSYFSQYFIMQQARQQGIKVMLDGQGSDEYLIGYLRSFYRLIGNAFPGPQAFRILNAHARREGYGPKDKLLRLGKGVASWLMDEQGLLALEYRKMLPFMPLDPTIPFHLANDGKDRVDNFLYHLLFNTELPMLLHHQDRNSMAFSIESRVPFLDHRMVEFAFSLPTDFKAHNGVTKYILREALKGVLPEKVYARMDKKGFVSPGEVQWLRGPLRHLLEKPLQEFEGINFKKALRIIDNYKKGDDTHARLAWRLVMLNDWAGR